MGGFVIGLGRLLGGEILTGVEFGVGAVEVGL